MKIGGLKMEMDRRFGHVDRRLEQIDQRFEQVDRRFEEIDNRFERVDQRFAAMAEQIASEGEKTRRHFDVVADQMRAERNLVLDQSMAAMQQLAQFIMANDAAHAGIEARLDEHEQRITDLERI
jgi:hypothetical protein